MKELLSHKGFRNQLIIGTLLVNIAIFAFVAISVNHSRIQFEERAAISTRNLSQVLDEYFEGVIAKTDVSLLSVLDEVHRQEAGGGLKNQSINVYMRRQLERIPEVGNILMTNSKGEITYGTQVASGKLINVGDRDYFTHLRDDPKSGTFISAPVHSRVTGKWIIIIARRIDHLNGSFAGVVFGAIWVEKFAETFSRVNVGKHGAITLFNSKLAIVCRFPEPSKVESVIGKNIVSKELIDLFAKGQSSATYRVSSTIDGINRTFSYRQIFSYPLYISVGLAKDDYLADWRNNIFRVVLIVTFFFLVTNISVWLIYRYIIELRLSGDRLRRMEADLRQSLREKETLLMEIHHRVKNNMAIVSSLLSLQAKTMKDPVAKQLFEESQQRVKSMSLVHEKLYQTKNLSAINFKDYIKAILQDIMSMHGADCVKITPNIDVEDIELDLESAVPCGLILNELLTNVCKYAFPGDRDGVLDVEFVRTGDTYTLTVRDNGVGLPEGFDYTKANTLGLQIVNALSKQLRGDFRVKSNNGTEAVLTFTITRE